MNMTWGYMKNEDIIEAVVDFLYENNIDKAHDYQRIRKEKEAKTPSIYTVYNYGIKWKEISERLKEKYNVKIVKYRVAS